MTTIEKHYEQTDELRLIALAQVGDSKSITKLIRSNENLIRYQLIKHGVGSSDVADLTQEVVIRCWRKLRTLRDPRRFKAWLCQIAANVCYSYYRENSTFLVSLDDPLPSADEEDCRFREIQDCSMMPHSALERKELIEHLAKSVHRLAPVYKEALLMREIDGYSYAEISVQTSVEPGTVKSRISRARSQVKRWMAPYTSSCA